MGRVWTATRAYATDIPTAYGYLESPPIAMNVLVEHAHEDSSSTLDARFIKHKGYAHGHDQPLLQDTFITGTAGRTGRAFDGVQGTWNSNWSAPYQDTHGIMCADSTLGQPFEAVSHDKTDGIESAEIIIYRGFPGVGGGRTYFTRQNTNCYLHLAYNQAPYADYRIALEQTRAVRIDVSNDGSGTDWKPVMAANRLITERLFQDNGNYARIRTWYDKDSSELWVEVGNETLHFFAGRNSPGNIRLIGKNGMVALEYYPLRSSPAKMTVGSRELVPTQHSNTASARVVVNGLTDTPGGQTHTSDIQTDGKNFAFSVTATMPDAGEGYGSATHAKLSDATLLIDEVYTDRIDGDYSTPEISLLRTICGRETQTWDDTQRASLTSGTLTLDNHDGSISGAFGNFALNLSTALIDSRTGSSGLYQRCAGVCGAGEEGIQIIDDGPMHTVRVPYCDKRVMMQVAVGQELNFGRWCIYDAARFVARACNIHSRYLNNIPKWKDGPAGPDCPYPVLDGGTGNNPKYVFTPEMSGWSILLYLASDAGLPIAPGISLPFWTGFDEFGQLRFEPYDPMSSLPTVHYTTAPAYFGNEGVLPILGRIEKINSTASMRSEVNFQGLHPITFQLAQVHLETSVAVRKAIGFRNPWLQRGARYGSNIVEIATTGVYAASLPSELYKFQSVYAPWVSAGRTCIVSDPGRGVGVYVIIGIQSEWGSDPTGKTGERKAGSMLLLRNATAYPTANGILF